MGNSYYTRNYAYIPGINVIVVSATKKRERERGALRVHHMEPPLSWNKEKKLPEEIFWLGLEGPVGVY